MPCWAHREVWYCYYSPGKLLLSSSVKTVTAQVRGWEKRTLTPPNISHHGGACFVLFLIIHMTDSKSPILYRPSWFCFLPLGVLWLWKSSCVAEDGNGHLCVTYEGCVCCTFAHWLFYWLWMYNPGFSLFVTRFILTNFNCMTQNVDEETLVWIQFLTKTWKIECYEESRVNSFT